MSVFETLNKINVNEHTEQKNNLTYLSWAWAWAEVKKQYPEAEHRIWRDEQGRPYIFDENLGYMVFTSITIEDLTHDMWLPVMDGANKAMKDKPYTITNKWGKEYTVQAATMFDINTAIMRCLVKNLGLFGLGLYIYAGEDLPEGEEPEIPAREQIIKFCDENGLDLKIVSERYGIRKGLAETVLKAKFDMLKKDVESGQERL